MQRNKKHPTHKTAMTAMLVLVQVEPITWPEDRLRRAVHKTVQTGVR